MTQSNSDSTAPLRTLVYEALTLWHQESAAPHPLQHLRAVQSVQNPDLLSPHQRANQVLLQALQLLEAQAEPEARLLRRRFLDNELVYKIANELNWAESTFYRKQNEAIDHLTQMVQTLEAQAQDERKARLLRRLDARTYVTLIGVDEPLAHLDALLHTTAPPSIILLEGMGGLGKTSLADALVRQLIDANAFADVGWVTARQQLFNLGGSVKAAVTPALTTEVLIETLLAQLIAELPRSALTSPEQARQLLASRLRDQPHLIVIDNLETLADVESLLPLLRDLANPTKFVLTSRNSFFGETGIYHFSVPELSPFHALQLARYEATLSNLPQVAQASDADLSPILATVGGNPLAIRLVVGQLHIHGLRTVLEDLRHAQGRVTERFYNYLYRRAWDNLDETARNTLLALPLAPEEGGDVAYLSTISGLDPNAVRTALDQLVRLNLVDSHGTLYERIYTIHNLTRTFLHEQVAKWG